MKPIIFYVDDEPMNLVVFEAAMPEHWDVMTFDTPAAALASLATFDPAVIVSDQKMPKMSGVELLELAKDLRPHAVRMIVTGYSDEDLVVQSVRKAQIFDYVKKPWNSDELDSSLNRAVDFFLANQRNRALHTELEERERLLQIRNRDLTELRTELECWVPPFVRWAVQDKSLRFPVTRDLTGITFDIVNSSAYHDVQIDGHPLRGLVIRLFSECMIRHDGYRESHSGDSAYGHFGLQGESRSADAALAAALEFRAGLAALTGKSAAPVACGIGLHLAKNALVDIHTVRVETNRGVVVQKSFDTASIDIDLLHRIEKLAHQIPGTNVIMSRQFRDQLTNVPTAVEPLGGYQLRGQRHPVELFLMRSELARDEDVARLREAAVDAAAPVKRAG